MSATRSRKPTDGDSTPQVPQSTPQSVGYGSSDHSFTLQTIMELQKSVGQMNATLLSMQASIDGMKSKVDDLVGWKNKILGGAAVLGVVIATLGFLIGKASEYFTFRQPSAPAAVVQPSAPVQAAPPAASKP